MCPLGNPVGHGNGFIAAGAEEGYLLSHQGVECGMILEIGIHCPFHLFKGDLLFIEYELLDDHEGIRHIRQADDGCTRAVVYSAALGDILSFADAAVDERREERGRAQHLVGFGKHMVVLDGLINDEFELPGEGIKEVIEGFERPVLDPAGIRPKLPVHHRVQSVIHGHLQGSHHIHHLHVGVADVLARKRRLNTAGG